MYDHGKRRSEDSCNWSDVPNETEFKIAVQRCVNCGRGSHHEQGVAVCWGPNGRFGADIASCTRSVLDDERLVEPLRKPLTNQPADYVGEVTSSRTDNDARRSRWVVLSPRNTTCDGHGCSTRRQLQEISTW